MPFRKKYALSFVISALLLIFLFSRVDFQKVFDILKTANLLLFFIAMSMTILSLSVKSLRWKFFLDVYKTKIRLLDIFSSFLASSFVANATPARVGEASRPYFLKRRYKTSFFNILPAVLIERAIDLVMLIIYSTIFLILFSSMASFIFLIVIFFASLIILSIVLIFLNKRISNSIINIIFKIFSFIGYISKLKLRVKKFVNKFYEGTVVLKKANFLAIFLLTAIAWFLESMVLFIVALSLNVPIPIIYCIGFTSLAVLGGAISSLPGGLGSTEIILFGFFLILGYSAPISLSITLLQRFATLGVGILFTSIFFIREVKH